ncbi:PAS domain-containing protein [Arcobacter sp. CECT 8985]|uniref:PAS domain-containing protein n=1 Tax=Arcobacter sp. CECT 8985 TaxID=1935424 RepID=UPI00100B4493|nr:PAS domain-containing protein [Arcobacter sp. CECT 8985]RXJ87564.1 hypothetical protein CRU93_03240 [Arcobacter sp. CECT 8985]
MKTVIEQRISNPIDFELLKDSILVFISDENEQNNPIINSLSTKFKKIEKITFQHKLQELINNQNYIFLFNINKNSNYKDLINQIQNKKNGNVSIIISINTEIIEALSNINILTSNILFNFSNENIILETICNALKYEKNCFFKELEKKELNLYKDILNKQSLISEINLEGIILYINSAFCEASGYDEDELLGKPHKIIRHPNNSSKIFEELWDTIKSGTIWKGKIKNITKDGNSYYVKSIISPVFDINGNIIKYVVSEYLITKYEKEKQTLKKYILQEKSKRIKEENDIENKYKELLKLAIESKDKQVAIFVSELHKEIKVLRSRIEDDKGRILNLEHKLSDANKKIEENHDDYLQKLSKMRTTTRISYEKYEKFKKQNDLLQEKLTKAQESIVVYQEYIEDYRKKIDDLNDVIKSYEIDKKKEKEKETSKK